MNIIQGLVHIIKMYYFILKVSATNNICISLSMYRIVYLFILIILILGNNLKSNIRNICSHVNISWFPLFIVNNGCTVVFRCSDLSPTNITLIVAWFVLLKWSWALNIFLTDEFSWYSVLDFMCSLFYSVL